MTSDPAGRRRDCVGPCRAPAIRAMGTAPGAARPAVMNVLSAPVFRLGLRALARGCHQPLQLGFHQIAQGSVLFAGQRLQLFSKVAVDAHVERHSFHCCHHAVVL